MKSSQSWPGSICTVLKEDMRGMPWCNPTRMAIANHDKQAALALAAKSDLDEREYVVELFMPEFNDNLDIDDCGGQRRQLFDHTEHTTHDLPYRFDRAFHLMKVSLKRLSSYSGYR